MMGLCSVTWENVKVSKQHNDSVLNHSFILLTCLFLSSFFQSSSASGQSGPPVPPVHPLPPCRTALSRTRSAVALKWSQSSGVSGLVWTLILVFLSPERRRTANVQGHLWRRGFVQMLTPAEVMVFVREGKKEGFTFIPFFSSVCLRQAPVPSLTPFWGKVINSAVCQSVCGNNMTLCSQLMILGRRRAELVGARQAWHLRKKLIIDWVRVTVTVTVLTKWL